MFSLKLDMLFPDLRFVKDLARKLNHKPPADPREIQRIRDELRMARDQQKAQALYSRYHVF